MKSIHAGEGSRKALVGQSQGGRRAPARQLQGLLAPFYRHHCKELSQKTKKFYAPTAPGTHKAELLALPGVDTPPFERRRKASRPSLICLDSFCVGDRR
jgi:hypothetical protein